MSCTRHASTLVPVIAVASQPWGTDRLPRTLVPMKATSGDLPTGEGWTYEVKWDGMRALAFVDGERLRVQSYNERDVTVSWPELRGLPDALPATTALLDGELVATDDEGRPSFGLLQQRMHVTAPVEVAARAAEVPVAYVVFDLLHLDGHDLCDAAARPIDGASSTRCSSPGPRWRVSPLHDDGPALLEAATARGLEGVVAKRLDSPLRTGQAHPHLAEGEGAAAPGDGGRRLAPGRGQPHRAHRRAARRLPRRARRRRTASLRRAGRHRASRTPS